MTTKLADDLMVGVLCDTIVALVRRRRESLSLRELSVFLTCYLDVGDHTVRGLAARLNVPRPAISRALDYLERFKLVRRKVNPRDRRGVLVQPTRNGETFLRELREMTVESVAARLRPQ